MIVAQAGEVTGHQAVKNEQVSQLLAASSA
jgi:hypothetical protein